jgi:hypothetical protein
MSEGSDLNASGNEFDGPGAEQNTPRRTQLLIAAGAVVVVVLVVVGVLVGRSGDSGGSASSTTTTPSSACGGDWPSAVKGKPTEMAKATREGFYAWSDVNGFHVRASDPNGTTPVSGKITSATGFVKDSVKVQPEGAAVKTEVAGNSLTFSFDASKDPIGFDFSMCGSVQAAITVNNKTELWPIDRFFTGSTSRAVSNPLVLARN